MDLFAAGLGGLESVSRYDHGLVAKENVVGTFGILFGFAEVAEDGQEIWGTLATHFSLLAPGLSLFSTCFAPLVLQPSVPSAAK